MNAGETVKQLSVSIDIKPGGTPNTINLKKDKTVTVALLGSSTFDVKQVDKSTVRFGGHTLQQPVRTSNEDVNNDSIQDLVMQFNVPPLGFTVSDTQGCLTGLTQDGTPFKGCDLSRYSINRKGVAAFSGRLAADQPVYQYEYDKLLFKSE